MKNLPFIFFAFGAFLLESCGATKKAPQRIENTTVAYAKDSVEYYHTEFEIIQKNYLDRLVGTWTLLSMQRQQRLPEEALDKVTLHLSPEMKFEVATTCGRISGDYVLKGTSIIFTTTTQHSMACPDQEKLSKAMELLTNTVSAYSVTSSELLLRDGSSNIVFKASK